MQIILATDGSKGSHAAAEVLDALPLESECTLTLLSVGTGRDEGTSETAIASTLALLGHTSARIERAVRHGHPAEEIVRAAEDRPTDLIVLGSHGLSAVARFFVGSVAERVARHAHCPVLLVRGRGAGGVRGPEIRRAIVGVDDSDGAAGAVEWLSRFPLPLECEIRLATVLPNLHQIAGEHLVLMPPLVEERIPLDRWQRETAQARLKTLRDSLAAAAKNAVTEVRSGDPAAGLVDIATDEGADLIVVGSHAWRGLDRFLTSGVSERVLRHAPCSVLVVR